MTHEPAPNEPDRHRLKERQGNTYLVTEDLSKLIKKWCTKDREEKGLEPLPYPKKRFFNGIMEKLCASLQTHCFPHDEADPDKNVKVENLPLDSFADILNRKRSKDAKRYNEFWVSLDWVYANVGEQEKDGFNISVTRFVDSDEKELKRGTRPEKIERFGSVREQIDRCVEIYRELSKTKERKVVLVDDGTFTGRTVVKILKLLAEQGVFVDSIRLGVAKPAAVNVIADWKDEKTGRGISFLSCLKLCPPVKDWVAERDFFPGVPLSGRVVGTMVNGTPVATRTNPLQKPVRKSYLAGWGNMQNWAAIDTGKDAFTIAALDLSIQLWEEIERLWRPSGHGPILVSELDAIPWAIYCSSPEKMKKRLEMRWVDVLKEKRDGVPG